MGLWSRYAMDVFSGLSVVRAWAERALRVRVP